MTEFDDPARIPHPEQVQNRIRDLGWSEEAARTTPIRKVAHKDGSPNIAEFARAAGKTPSETQRLVRSGVPLEEAVKRASE